MRTALVGAVDSTRTALEALVRAGFPPALLVTLPPERAGRHSDFVDLRPAAARLGVEVMEAADANHPDVLARLRDLAPDHVFVIGWSQICRPDFLALPAHGCIGYHPSALPENRGRAVIPWTILQRAAETGSTLFWMDEGMDSGDVLAQERFAVAPDETAASLYAKHMQALAAMLMGVLPRLADGTAPRRPQDHARATWCARRTRDDGWIDWTRPADEVWTLVRASGEPYPGAFTACRGQRLVVWSAERVDGGRYWGLPGQVQAFDAGGGALVQCGDRGHVRLRVVQLGDGERVDAREVLRMHEKLGIGGAEVFAALGAGGRP